MCTIKTAKFGTSNGVYASLSPSVEGIKAIEKCAPIVLQWKIHMIVLLVQTNTEVMMIYTIPQEREEERVAICYHLLRSSSSQRTII